MAQQQQAVPSLELPAWKTALNWIAAILTSLLFIAAGLWKITDPIAAAVRLAQAKVPENLSLAAALLLGIAETVTAVLVLVPRFRKWGAWLAGALLLVFMLYIGVNYNALRGAECNCFPLIKRAVGPGFFIGDAVMLLFAVLAGFWAQSPESRRSAVLVLGAVTVFALVSYGATAVRQHGVKQVDRALQIHRDHLLPEIRLAIEEQRELVVAGVVDEHVDAPELVACGGHQRVGLSDQQRRDPDRRCKSAAGGDDQHASALLRRH